ncbi:MAG: hypothetical protein AABY77_04665 [Nitrospirota bacterium]
MSALPVRAGILALAIAALCTTESIAQAPRGDTGPPTQTQTQRDQTPINLDIIDKQKPEIEIYTGQEDPSQQGLRGIIVVPEEAAKTPPPPTGEPDSHPKKKRD